MAPPSSSPKKPSNLTVRILSALVLIPVVLAVGYLGHPWFDLFVILFAGIMAWEWARIAGRRRNPADPSPAARLPVGNWTLEASALVFFVLAVLTVLRPPLMEGFPGNSINELGDVLGALFIGISLLMGAGVSTLAAVKRHRSRAVWFGVGFLYVSVPALALLWLREDPVTGQGIILLAWIRKSVV